MRHKEVLHNDYYAAVRDWVYCYTGEHYLLFAGCSTLLALGPRAIVLIQAGLVAAALLSRLVWWVVRRRSRAGLAGSGGEEMTLAAAEIGHGRPEV